MEGFKLRANWASSFVAPELSSVGDRSRGGQTSFTSYTSTTNNFVVNTAAFPSAIGIPGCSAAQAAAQGNSCTFTTALQGVSFNGSRRTPRRPRGAAGRSVSM